MPCAAVLAALIGGCGGAPAGSFAARAGAVCTSALRAERALTPPSFRGTSAARARSLDTYLRGDLAIVEAEDRQLRALPRPRQPARERVRVAAYLSAMHTLPEIVHNLVISAPSSQLYGISNAALGALPVSRLAAQAGLPACAVPGPTIRSEAPGRG